MKRKILILICLIVFIFSIVSVSASDDFNQTEDNVIGDEDALSVSQGDIEISESADNGTFTDLQKIIDDANEKSIITLERDYQYDNKTDKDVISISKRLTINGDGHIIKGDKSKGIFYISENIILNEICFIDGNSSYGGAIYGDDYFTVRDCSFVNCSANRGAGAIYSNHGICNVFNCSFVDCSSGVYGGAIWFNGDGGAVNSCSFVDCSSGDGGAIHSRFDYHDLTVVNSSFVNCSSNRGGGVINSYDYYSRDNLIIVNCSFVDCSVGGSGEVIVATGDLTVVNCSFINNSPKFDVDIGANNIAFYSTDLISIGISVTSIPYFINSTGNITIKFNGKEETIRLINGFAIFSSNGLEIGDYDLFVKYGGDDACKDCNKTFRISIVDSDYHSFKDLQDLIDDAEDGASIELNNNYIYGLNCEDKTIEINKTLTINGNGYNIDGNNNRIANIVSNNVVLNNIGFINGISDFGGAVCSYDVNLSVVNCSFVDCSADFGGAIYSLYDNLTVSNCSFMYCSASRDSGAIYSYGDLNLDNCSFVNCSATYGGAISMGIYEGFEYSGGKCNLVNCSFVDCSASVGAAIDGCFLNVSDCSFVNCFGRGMYGGVIHVPSDEDSIDVEKEFYLMNSSFVNCTGGAVAGVNFAIDCCFVNCSDYINEYDENGGGAVSGAGSVVGCCFVNCSGTAIYVEAYYSSVIIGNCSFVNCSGVAINVWVYYSSVIIGNCSYVNCSAGAINFVENRYVNFVVVDCSFVNCSRWGSGGTIRFESYNSSLSVVNCTFVNCSARHLSDRSWGGAIFSFGSRYCNLIIENCSFVNCSGECREALSFQNSDNSNFTVNNCSFMNCLNSAIFGASSVSNCCFVNCSAARGGGAISGDCPVSNCCFVNCSVGDFGGAIYGASSVVDCCFVNCSSDFGGAICTDLDSFICNCTFINCSAGVCGGAIHSSNNSGVINCTFINCFSNDEIHSYGGAIYNDGMEGAVFSYFIDCSFVNCSVKTDGGAIWGYYAHLNISNCSFVDCSAGGYGGGITVIFCYDCDIDNCSFVDCSAVEYYGDAIDFVGSQDCVVSNCTFVYFGDGGVNVTYHDVGIFDLYEDIVYFEENYYEIFNCTLIKFGAIEICAPDVTKDYMGPECLEITLTESGKPVENADVNININSIDYTKTTDKNGKASLDLDLNAGTYDAIVSYRGTSTTAKITVNQLNTETTLSSTKNSPNTVTLTAVINSTTAAGDVVFTVNNENYTAEISGGKATYKLSNLEVGSYDAKAVYNGETNYKASSSNTITFTVEDAEYDVNAPDLTKYYHGPERFVVTVRDKPNNPVAGKNVTINLNGATYTRTTNENGEASMAINLNSGVYKVTSEFEGIEVESTITVKSTVSGENITKIFRNGTQYYATFVDTSGKTLAENTAVEFNINGVFYTRYTNEKGVARMNINLNPGEYIITAKNPNSGEMYTNIVTVLPSIVENYDLTKYYKNASRYSLRVLDDKGNPVKAGVDVKLNINGVFYTRTSDDDGYVKMNINLEPGEYTITAEYNGLMASNKITVLSVIETHDLSMKYRDGSKFEAKILDGQGKAYAGQTVTFNINGVFYEKVTDENGIARLTINLMAGEYIITSSYNGMNAANKVTVSS